MSDLARVNVGFAVEPPPFVPRSVWWMFVVIRNELRWGLASHPVCACGLVACDGRAPHCLPVSYFGDALDVELHGGLEELDPFERASCVECGAVDDVIEAPDWSFGGFARVCADEEACARRHAEIECHTCRGTIVDHGPACDSFDDFIVDGDSLGGARSLRRSR